MADAKAVRAWAGSKGRGKLPGPVIDRWNTEHPEDPYMSSSQHGTETSANGHSQITLGPLPAGDAADFEDAFNETAAGDADLFPEPVEEQVRETPPRRAKPAGRGPGKSRGGLPNILNRTGGHAKSKQQRKPRVSTADLLAGGWRALAKLATPLPPLQRTLRIQAPVAGDILEDAVRGTVFDAVLQPVARISEAGKKVNAVLGPPAFTTALCLEQQRAAAAGTEPNPVVVAVCIEGLRSAYMSWMEVAGPKFEKALAREREFEDKYGQSVDEMINFIFSPPPASAAEAAAEDDMIRHAQGVL